MPSTRWGAASGYLLNPHGCWDQHGNRNKTKTGPKDLKQKRNTPPRISLREILQQGAESSGGPLRGPAATSEPAVEISAKDSDEPVVRNLSEVKSKTILLGVSSKTYHCRELVLLDYLQQDKDWDI
jgi:hypothetical protein